MDEHKLKIFCAVAEAKSFSKASEIMRLTQPAVSLQIQALEESCGTKLFNRAGSLIKLTKAGDVLYNYAKDIISLYNAAEKEIGQFTEQEGIITIGASSTAGNYILPSVISDFKRKFPKINTHLIIGNTKTVVDYLYSDSIDLAIVAGDIKKQKLVVEKLIPDEMVFIMSPLHPLAKRSSVSVLEVTKEPFIIREEGSGTRQIIERFLSKHAIHLQNIKNLLIMGSTEAVKSSVEEGLGVSIISKWAVRKELRYGKLKASTFKEEQFVRNFSLLYRKTKNLSYMLDRFINFMKKYPFEKKLAS
jgi:DNA-binding transcriptional LysR family regulator